MLEKFRDARNAILDHVYEIYGIGLYQSIDISGETSLRFFSFVKPLKKPM